MLKKINLIRLFFPPIIQDLNVLNCWYLLSKLIQLSKTQQIDLVI